MAKFPIFFEATSEATCDINAAWTSKADKAEPMSVALPPEFQGPSNAYTPEDLYALSILNCLIGVYKTLCSKQNIQFEKIEGKAIAKLDKSSCDEIEITEIEITLDVLKASDKEKARSILDDALKHCPISNSIKSCKIFHLNVT